MMNEQMNVMEFYDDCHDRKTSANRNNWLSAIVIVLILIAIAYIWQKNQCERVIAAEKLGSISAKVGYDHETLAYTVRNQRQDEEYAFWTKPAHCNPCQPAPCGYGYPYGGCAQPYGYNAWPVNGYPPMPIPQSEFKKVQCYESKGNASITETETV